ncbi:MAG TPA: thioredoxin domain-containing protein [Pyrinomonadaceae bacterium]|nr:thioredoxin domain-containing protein [Pyrinomonadaceae bacterium]
MNNTKNNDSKLPLAIIGLVLIAAIVGGWWFYSSSKSQPVTKQTNTNSANKQAANNQAAMELYARAPAGASPANMLGAPTATATVEEFADFQCPTCATIHTKMKEINSLYSGRIKFIYRNFPLTQIHKNAYDAAVAAEAAGQQGKFWAMQDQLFNNQQAWSNSGEARKLFEGYANKIGLDIAKFQSDMAGLPTKTRVDADLQRGRALAVGGTPTIFINGVKLAPEQMEVNTMRQLIDAELQKAGNQTQSSQPATSSAANQSVNGSTGSNASSDNSVNK